MASTELRPAAPRWLPWVLAACCLAVRLPGLELPLLEEGHAWRQSVTAMIARNFHRHGYRLCWPEIDVPPKGRPLGTPSYTNSELPLYPWLVAVAWQATGVRDDVARLLSALAATGAVVLLYLLLRRLGGAWTAAVGAAWCGLHPLGIFFTRAVLPEPLMLLAVVGAMLATVVWLESGSRRAWAAALLAATLAPLLKQPALHLLPALAVAGWAAGRRRGEWGRGALLVLTPLVATLAWYRWATWLGDHYAGHFAVGGGSGLINPALWAQAAFRLRFAVVAGLLVGLGTGPLVALCGLSRPRRATHWVLAAWLAGAVAAAVVANGATVSHYYYNLALLPPLGALVGWGCGRWARPRLRWLATLLALVGPLLLLSLGQVQSWYDVRPGEVAAAAAVRRVVPQDGLVYTICYGTQLLYASDRRGDFLLPDPAFLDPRYVRDAAAAGFRYLATGRRELLESDAGQALRDYLATRRRLAAGPGYLVYDLTQAAERP